MNISEEGVGLIKRFEGCRLESYRDSVGVWTIGYGSTRGVGPDQVITQEEADRRLLMDLETVEKCIANCVSVELTQGQYDCLSSWIFNLGCGAFRNSTLLKKINEGDDIGAADEILRWDHAGGVKVDGLTSRREAEKKLFLS